MVNLLKGIKQRWKRFWRVFFCGYVLCEPSPVCSHFIQCTVNVLCTAKTALRAAQARHPYSKRVEELQTTTQAEQNACDPKNPALCQNAIISREPAFGLALKPFHVANNVHFVIFDLPDFLSPFSPRIHFQKVVFIMILVSMY